MAKEDSVSHRRLAFDRLRDDKAVGVLFKELGPRFKTRPGGYLRILKMGFRADGDRAAARSAREGRRAEGTAHDGVSRSSSLDEVPPRRDFSHHRGAE